MCAGARRSPRFQVPPAVCKAGCRALLSRACRCGATPHSTSGFRPAACTTKTMSEALTRTKGTDEPAFDFESVSVDQAYDVLELPQGASRGKIKSKYRKLALKVHPDRKGQMTVQRSKSCKQRMIVYWSTRSLTSSLRSWMQILRRKKVYWMSWR